MVLLYIPSRIVKINAELIKKNEVPLSFDDLESETGSSIGLVVSAIFSLIIASMIYFRVVNGINFISWGILFGIITSIIIIKGDKTILGLFYFLDPNGAIYLFHLHKLKGVKEKASFIQDIQKEKSENIKDIYVAKLTKLSNELSEHKNKLQYEYIENIITSQIERLKDPNLTLTERLELHEKTDEMIAAVLKDSKDIVKITHAIEASRPLRDKIADFVGLTEEEQIEGISLGLISEDQKFLWNKDIQSKIKRGKTDFDNRKFKEQDQILFANSILQEYPINSQQISELIEKLNTHQLVTEQIIGTEIYGLEFCRFSTINRDFIVIFKDKSNSILIHCLHENRIK